MENKINKVRIVLVGLLVVFLLGTLTAGVKFAKAGDETDYSKAVNALSEGEAILNEFSGNNFSVSYMNDTLTEAKRVFEQAKYAEILRNKSSNYIERKEAESALKLIDWKNITYASVLPYIESMKDRKEEAFLIFDSLTATKSEIKDYETMGVNASEEKIMLDGAKNAFYEDRYKDAKNILGKINDNLEKKSAELTTLRTLNRAAMNFFERNWEGISIIAVLLIILALVSYKKIRVYLLKRKLEKLKSEEKAIIELIKEIQKRRYVENTISDVVYQIRMKKYKENLNKIRRMIPIVKGKLRKRH